MSSAGTKHNINYSIKVFGQDTILTDPCKVLIQSLQSIEYYDHGVHPAGSNATHFRLMPNVYCTGDPINDRSVDNCNTSLAHLLTASTRHE